MKKFLFLFFICGFAHANSNTGVGLILGAPSGISARHWVESDRSIEANFGWSVLSKSRLYVNASYLWNKVDVFQVKDEAFDVFFGGGLSVRTKSGTQDGELVFGPRVPVGVAYLFTDPKIELFGEAGLNVGIIPSSDIYLDAGVGVRFYFE